MRLWPLAIKGICLLSSRASVPWGHLAELSGAKAKLFVPPACLWIVGSSLPNRKIEETKCHRLQHP